MSRRDAGFTLVEVLVVLAIIMMLAGLLLPVLGRAREESRRASCATRLGQIGKAQMDYMGQNRDYWAFQYDARVVDAYGRVNGHPKLSGTESGYHNASVSLSILYPAWLENLEVFQCPSSGDRPQIEQRVIDGYRYSWFGRQAGKEYDVDAGKLSVDSPFKNGVNLSTSFGYDDLAGRRDMLPASARVADMRWVGTDGREYDNHGGDGQNVLYWGGQVAFSDSVYASADTQDDIYKVDYGTSQYDRDAVLVRTHADAY